MKKSNLKIPIFLSSDDNYAPFVATTIASICNNTEAFCEFYVLDSGISNENKNKICYLKNSFKNFSIEFINVKPEEEFKNINYCNAGNYISISTYNRFLIPKVKPELEKVLYLDVDIVVLGDIAELYNQELEGYALGAIWDKSRALYNTETKTLVDLSENYKYFNAGILVIDVQKWKKENIIEKLFEIERKYQNKIRHADETLLNKYFDGSYKILNIKYNYTDFDTATNPQEEIVIRHFATHIKPWQIHPDIKTKLCPNTQDFWKYAEMTPFFTDLLDKCNSNTSDEIIRQIRIRDMVHKRYIQLETKKLNRTGILNYAN